MVVEEGRALVIGVNQWDSGRDREARLAAIRDRLERSLPQKRVLPVVTLSALQGHNIEAVMDRVLGAYEVWRSGERREGQGRVRRVRLGGSRHVKKKQWQNRD